MDFFHSQKETQSPWIHSHHLFPLLTLLWTTPWSCSTIFPPLTLPALPHHLCRTPSVQFSSLLLSSGQISFFLSPRQTQPISLINIVGPLSTWLLGYQTFLLSLCLLSSLFPGLLIVDFILGLLLFPTHIHFLPLTSICQGEFPEVDLQHLLSLELQGCMSNCLLSVNATEPECLAFPLTQAPLSGT